MNKIIILLVSLVSLVSAEYVYDVTENLDTKELVANGDLYLNDYGIAVANQDRADSILEEWYYYDLQVTVEMYGGGNFCIHDLALIASAFTNWEAFEAWVSRRNGEIY